MVEGIGLRSDTPTEYDALQGGLKLSIAGLRCQERLVN